MRRCKRALQKNDVDKNVGLTVMPIQIKSFLKLNLSAWSFSIHAYLEWIDVSHLSYCRLLEAFLATKYNNILYKLNLRRIGTLTLKIGKPKCNGKSVYHLGEPPSEKVLNLPQLADIFEAENRKDSIYIFHCVIRVSVRKTTVQIAVNIPRSGTSSSQNGYGQIKIESPTFLTLKKMYWKWYICC